MTSMKTLRKLNAISGLAFAVFIVMHYFCHYSLTLFGWDAANSNMRLFRIIYQNPVFEVLLLLSVIVHGYANINMKFIRDKLAASAVKKKNDDGAPSTAATASNLPGSMEYQAHRMAGYVIGVSLIGHVVATRVSPLLALKDPSIYDYSFVAKVVELVPFNLLLVYLCIFAMAGGWHSIYGTWSAIHTLRGSSVTGKIVPIQLKMLALSSHILIISAMFALGGAYYTIDTTTKAKYYDQVFAIMGLH